MKSYLRLAATAAIAALVVPTLASAFTGRLGTRVNPVDGAVFEVIPRSSGSTGIFWCGASDYARRALGAGWSERIYVARGRDVSVTTGRRSSVQFTLNPGAAGITPQERGGIKSGFTVGDSMSVQQAGSYCSQFPVRY